MYRVRDAPTLKVLDVSYLRGSNPVSFPKCETFEKKEESQNSPANPDLEKKERRCRRGVVAKALDFRSEGAQIESCQLPFRPASRNSKESACTMYRIWEAPRLKLLTVSRMRGSVMHLLGNFFFWGGQNESRFFVIHFFKNYKVTKLFDSFC